MLAVTRSSNIKKLIRDSPISRFFSWVYTDGKDGYNNDEIEASLGSCTGGSVDLTMNHQKGIGLLKINNPSKKNAFTGKMMVDLRKASEELLSWKDGKAVILYGADHMFCSGADFATVKKFPMFKEGVQMCMYMQNTLTLLHQLPLLTVAFVEGKALGGGAELTTACDFRLMNEDAEIQFVHKNMGLIPGWGGVTRLNRLIGRDETLRILSTAGKVNAFNALELGLVNKVIHVTQRDLFHEISRRGLREAKDFWWMDSNVRLEEEDLPDITLHHAVDWLERKFGLESTSPSILQAIKSSVVCCDPSLNVEESLKNERDIFKSLWGADDNLRALEKVKHSL